MQTFSTLIMNGLTLSAMYILVALGFALLLSIMNIFNFAHGAIYMVGAYITEVIIISLGVNNWIALLVSIIITGAFGLFLERFFFRRLVGNIDGMVMFSIALTYILQTTVNLTIGGMQRSIPHFVDAIIKTEYFSFSADRLVTLIIGIVLLTVIYLFIRYSKIGRQMLAISQDSIGAALQGININNTAAIACVIGCGLAALSGSLMGAMLSINPFMGDTILTKAIEIVILSGIGSTGGILVGGLIIGMVDAILPVYFSGAASSAVGLFIIILILLLRPKGLFGYELRL